tara:strand:+ start:2426 stop:2749 length:324 start_codon:yes stop_codon:yes gene_type:complete
MFLFFETSVNFDTFTFRPRINFSEDSAFFHSNGNEYGSKICPFGKSIIFLFVAILLLRNYISIPKYIMIATIIIAILMSFINLNALVYILPVIFYEICLQVVYRNNK